MPQPSSHAFVPNSLMSAVVYVDNYDKAIDFYTRVLGLKPFGPIQDKPPFLYLGNDPNGIYLEGGFERASIDIGTARLSFMLHVPSAVRLFQRLQTESVCVVQDAPRFMGENAYWFQVYDPSGNIIEIVGGA